MDPTQKRHGRGAYACHNKKCLLDATRRGSFARALKTSIPDELMKGVAALGHEMS